MNMSSSLPAFSFTRSHLFSVYNKARLVARTGKLDVGRVNRALGILQSKAGAASLRHYEASTRDCWCEDRRRRRIICKHQIAAMIATRATELKGAR